MDAALRDHAVAMLRRVLPEEAVREATAVSGRNQNLLLQCDSGRRYLFKQLVARADESTLAARCDRAHRVAALVARDAPCTVATVDAVAAEPASGRLLMHYVDGTTMMALLRTTGAVPAAALATAGAQLRRVHALPVDRLPGPCRIPAPCRAAQELLAIAETVSMERYRLATRAEMALWRALQADAPLATMVAAMLDRSQDVPDAVVHGDLRLDQLVVGEDAGVAFLDWEDAGLADPATDLGGLLGSILFAALLHRLGALAQDATADDARQSAAEGLLAASVSLRALLDGYGDAEELAAVPLRVRATAYAGLHLYDRLLVHARHQDELSPAVLLIAGIGRGLLADPERGARDVLGSAR